MENNKRRILLAVLLIISVGNYFIIVGIENVRNVQFLSIFAIGAITALLIKEVFGNLKK